MMMGRGAAVVWVSRARATDPRAVVARKSRRETGIGAPVLVRNGKGYQYRHLVPSENWKKAFLRRTVQGTAAQIHMRESGTTMGAGCLASPGDSRAAVPARESWW